MRTTTVACAALGALLVGCSESAAPGAPAPLQAAPQAAAAAQQRAGTPAPAPGGTVTGADARGFVGKDRCLTCHQEQHAAWEPTAHSRALRPASKDSIHAPFSGAKTTVGQGENGFRVFERDGELFVNCLGQDRTMGDFRIDWSIGDRRAHMLIHEFPDGRLQVLPAFVDIPKQNWFPYWEFFFDIGGKGPIYPEDYRFWANPGRGFQAAVFADLCINCHTTGATRGFDPATNRYTTTWVDPGVSCEACHGPGAAHVHRRERMRSGKATAEQAANWVPLKVLSSSRSMEACAQCHASKQQLQPGFRPGEPWFDYYMPVLLDDTVHIQPDGKSKEFNYSWIGIQQSACFRLGDAHCLSCHQPHGSDYPVLLRHDPKGDEACLQCHEQRRGNEAAHHHHPMESEGARCVNCHMPYLTIENGHGKVRDHSISVPRPRNNRVHGIPDACTRCHTDQKPEWAEAKMREWWPERTQGPRRHEVLADIVAGGRAGDPKAEGALLRMLRDPDELWMYRASAARLLGAYPSLEARGALLALFRAKGTHPVLAPSALFGLIGHAMRTREASLVALLQQSLEHDSLAVRQYAALALVSLSDRGRAKRVRAIVQGIVDFLPDNVDHRGALANAAALDGDPAAAWGHHEVNLRIFPMSRSVVTGAQGLALAQRRAAEGRGEAAQAQMWAERAIGALDAYLAKRPDDAWGLVLRGYTRLEAGDRAGALRDATSAQRLSPNSPEPGLEKLVDAIRIAGGSGR